MPVGLTKAKTHPERLLEEMSKLSLRQLEEVIEGASQLRVEKSKSVVSKRESELLWAINQGLSDDEGGRLKLLREKLRDGSITRREHSELLKLADKTEALAANRLKAIIDLAGIRKIPVRKLMRDLKLNELAYA